MPWLSSIVLQKGHSVLMFALVNKHLDTAHYIINHMQPDLCAVDNDGISTLSWAYIYNPTSALYLAMQMTCQDKLQEYVMVLDLMSIKYDTVFGALTFCNDTFCILQFEQPLFISITLWTNPENQWFN